jgi:predicted AAA+ superfamily ATPase
LSGDLASSLTGRYAALNVLPFSFLEFFKYKNGNEAEKNALYNAYKNSSGYPDLILKGENPSLYINTLFDSIVLRDIVKKYKLRNVNLISSLYNRLAHSICSKVSYRQLEKDLEKALTVNTIKKYLGYANEAYLFLELQPFFFKPRLRMKADRKLYAIDHGYINFKSVNIMGSDSNLMENIVFIELIRRGFEVNASLFYYQTREGHEVDFLTRNSAGEIELLQVSYSLESAKTRERELRSLVSAKSELGAISCKVITMGPSVSEIVNGVKIDIIGIADWLIDS